MRPRLAPEPDKDLTHTVCHSVTGKQVFGEAYHLIEAENMSVLVKKKSLQLMRLPAIDQKALTAARSAFCAEAEALGVTATKAFAKTMELPVTYRGVDVQITPQSYLEHFQYQCIAAIKSVAVDNNALMPCLCENDLVRLPRPESKCNIDEALLTEASIARSSIRDYADELADMCGDTLATMLKSKLQILKAMDRHIGIEDAFFRSMTGVAGQDKFKDVVAACLGSEASPLSWADARAKLEKLLETPVCKFSDRGLLSQAHTVLGWLRSGEGGRSPTCISVVSDFLVSSRSKLSNFCTTQSGEQTLMGKAALDHMFGLMKTKAASNELGLLDLKNIAAFKWMMTPEQAADFQTWTDGALVASGRKGAPRMEPAPDPAPKRRRKAKTSTAEDDAAEEVANSYFQ